MAKKKVADLIADELSDFLEQNGYELFFVEFAKEGKDWFLRVFIDKKGAPKGDNVSTEDCERVSRYLSGRLDELDPIEQNYYLEVSSPGMDRPLRNQQDYQKYQGESVEISLYRGVNGKKQISGVLEGLSDGAVIVRSAQTGERMEIPLDQIAKTKLAVVF